MKKLRKIHIRGKCLRLRTTAVEWNETALMERANAVCHVTQLPALAYGSPRTVFVRFGSTRGGTIAKTLQVKCVRMKSQRLSDAETQTLSTVCDSLRFSKQGVLVVGRVLMP